MASWGYLPESPVEAKHQKPIGGRCARDSSMEVQLPFFMDVNCS